MKLIDLIIIILAAMFFAVLFNMIAERDDAKQAEEIESRAFEDAEIRAHEIRQSGIIGLNLNGNSEL